MGWRIGSLEGVVISGACKRASVFFRDKGVNKMTVKCKITRPNGEVVELEGAREEIEKILSKPQEVKIRYIPFEAPKPDNGGDGAKTPKPQEGAGGSVRFPRFEWINFAPLGHRPSFFGWWSDFFRF